MIIEALITEVLPELGLVKTQVVKYTNGKMIKRIFLPKFSMKVPFDVIEIKHSK